MPFDPSVITSGEVVNHRQVGAVTIIEAWHPPGMEIPLHAHPALFLTYVAAGSFTEIVDGVDYRCTPGDVLLKPMDSAHANRYGRRGAYSFVVEIPRRVIPARLRSARRAKRSRVFNDARITRLMARFHEESRYADQLSPLVVEELLGGVLESITESSGQTFESIGDDKIPEWLETVYERVRDEFREKPSLSKLADQAGVHPDYLSRAFRECFGSTIGDQVRHWRVKHAAREVRMTERALSAIAYNTGFADQSHMTRQMRRHLGVTPGQLRSG